jgi:hypothetical protein
MMDEPITVEDYLEAMETVKQMFERDVIYTGGFRFFGKAIVAEVVCKECQREFWVNYTCPKPLCADCDEIPHRSSGLGRINESVATSQRQYHGEILE